jgi:hypothetical protein
MSVQEAVKNRVLQDLRSGKSDPEIMHSHSLSYNDLRKFYQMLFDEGLLYRNEDSDEVEPVQKVSKETLPELPTGIQQDRRDAHRCQMYSEIPVREIDQPQNQGVVYDLTEAGMRLLGMEAEVDEIKNLVVCDDVFGEVAPFELEAKCRWVEKYNGSANTMAGFEITKISNEDLERLRELMQAETV